MRGSNNFNRELKPQIRATLHLNSNNPSTTAVLTDANFVANSLTLREGTSVSDEFTVGGAVISVLTFTLMNDTGQINAIVTDWYDARVSLDLTVENSTFHMGYFYVAKHHEQGNFVTVECYDALKILDEYQLYELQITDSQWETGLTISSLASLIAAKTGMGVSGLNSYGSIVVHNPNNDQMTLRACLSYLAQMTGQFVKTHYLGMSYVFGWYDKSGTPVDAGTTFSHDFRTNNISIDGVTVSDYKDENVATRGGSTYAIEIKDNPFIDASNYNQVANAVYAAVNGITFRPGTASILASPAYEAGDKIKVATGQEQNIVTYLTNITYKPQVTESITADAEPYEGDLRLDRTAYIKNMAKDSAQDTLDSNLNDPDSELSQKLNKAGSDSNFIRITNTYGDDIEEVSLGQLGCHGIIWIRHQPTFGEQEWEIVELPCHAISYIIQPIGFMYDIPKYEEDIEGVRGWFMRLPVSVTVKYESTLGNTMTAQGSAMVEFACAYDIQYDGEIIDLYNSDYGDFTAAVHLNNVGNVDTVLYFKVPIYIHGVGANHHNLYLQHTGDNMWELIDDIDLPSDEEEEEEP